MAPLIEYVCAECTHIKETIVSHPIPEAEICEKCGKEATRVISYFAGYKWGASVNNSASTVPKKYRGEN